MRLPKKENARRKTKRRMLLTKTFLWPHEKTANLNVYTDGKKHGVECSMLTCPTEFVQTLNDMCSDAKMMCLYKHFVLCGSILLSMYWREACAICDDKKVVDGTLKWN